MGTALFFIGLIIAAIGGIGILIAAFRESFIWGLGCLLVPIVGLIFVVTHWQESKKPFLLNLGGAVIMIAGKVMIGPQN